MPSKAVKRIGCSTAVYAAGLALAGYLAALKWLGLPCVGAGCGAVIGSSYGTILGVPVGALGAAAWLLVLFVPRARLPGLILLAAGSVWFTAVQVFILRTLCPWCLAHALTTWVAAALWRAAPSRHAVWIGVSLALGGTLLAHRDAQRTVAAQASAADSLFAHPAALAWLGPFDRTSPVLVLSLSCPRCLDLLGELAAGNLARQPAGPALFLKIEPTHRDLSAVFAAAVAAQGGDRDAFLTVCALLQTQRDLILSQPAAAATWLETVFPPAAAHRAVAETQLARNNAALAAARITATPLLIAQPGQPPQTIFPPEAIFPPVR